VIVRLGFHLEAELRSSSAQRPDPTNPTLNLETVLRSFVALRPDLIAPHSGDSSETVLQAEVAQGTDNLFLMPTNVRGRVDTAWLT
jgi:hypothetical protein